MNRIHKGFGPYRFECDHVKTLRSHVTEAPRTCVRGIWKFQALEYTPEPRPVPEAGEKLSLHGLASMDSRVGD